MPTLPPRPPRRARRVRFRRPVPYWSVAGAVALATAILVGTLVADTQEERARWRPSRPVLVLAADVAGGDAVSDGAVRVRQLPAGFVPDGALRRLPAGAVAAVDLHRGEVLVETRLIGPGSSLLAARLPAGTRGIAVPDGSGLPLEVGDRVDVLATFDPTVDGDGEPTFPVARRAAVLHVGDGAVTLAVEDHDATRVVYALATGIVTLVLSGSSSPPP